MKIAWWVRWVPALLVSGATAADNPVPTDRPRGEAVRAKILQRFDKDGDGQLDEAEREAARKAWQEKRSEIPEHIRGGMLKRFDKDGDGQLSREEREAAKAAMRERRRHCDKSGPRRSGEESEPSPGDGKSVKRQAGPAI